MRVIVRKMFVCVIVCLYNREAYYDVYIPAMFAVYFFHYSSQVYAWHSHTSDPTLHKEKTVPSNKSIET